MTKLKLLTNSIHLFIILTRLKSCNNSINHYQKTLSLTHPKLTKLSNNYQKLTTKWVDIEKKLLFLRAFIRIERNKNL